MAYKPVQLITKHSPACAMNNGLNPGNPWCMPRQVFDGFLGQNLVQRDLSGRRNSRAQHSWLLFRCADNACPAQLAIYWPKVEADLKLDDERWKEADHV